MKERLTERFITYVKKNTRSDENSSTVPSTQVQVDFAQDLAEELKSIGLSEVSYHEKSGFVTASLPSNIKEELPTIGFIAHMDTADYPSEHVQPQILENYDGGTIVLDSVAGIEMTPELFPNLNNYVNQTLIHTDGHTLLGADDKAGIAEIVTAMDYLIQHPEIQHGKIRLAFGPDEEIGRGAQNFDVEAFGADFAYTVDGGPVGELQYESFNAAQADLVFHGLDVHPGSAKDKMVNAILLATAFVQELPQAQRPEKTDGRQGFYHVMSFQGSVEESRVSLIIRDHDREAFEAKKSYLEEIVEQLQAHYGQDAVDCQINDQYYNMAEVIEKDMYPIDLAVKAMEKLEIDPIIEAIRGGTDGSIISFMGLPTPNLFAGGENFHGKYEFVAVESMVKACQTIIEISHLHSQLERTTGSDK